MKYLFALSLVSCLLFANQVSSLAQDDKGESKAFTIAKGKIAMKSPKAWIVVEPAVNFIEAEFSVPAHEDDEKNGRVTLMGAGGSIEANLDRWIAQFKQADGSATKDVAKITKKEVKKQTLHVMDVSGTYMDQRGPASPKVDREGYRMLAAIIETEDMGNYFVKFYGPEKTVAANRDAFVKLVEGFEIESDDDDK